MKQLQYLGLMSLGLVCSVAATGVAATPQTLEVLSPTYTVDRKYRSMEGPQSTQQIELLPEGPPELIWITGANAVMVGADGTKPMPQEFMCHSNLDVPDVDRHRTLFGWTKTVSTRLFTLSQGQVSIKFPEGFGIPLLSTEALSLTTQVLNHNVKGEAFQVRHKVTIEYVRDRELDKPMRPLFSLGAYNLALLDGDQPYFGVKDADVARHGPGCLIAANASSHTYQDPLGRIFTGHWVVRPGREVNRTLVTKIMNVPFNTTIHYIAVHLHPFAESLQLRDLTTGKSLFKSRARNFANRIGLDQVDVFSSVEGIPVFKDHEYEIVSVYHNTTDENQDAMAVMYLYLLDKEIRDKSL